jgi:hypothetical protein
MSQTVSKITAMLEPLVRSGRHHARWRLLVDIEATCWLEVKDDGEDGPRFNAAMRSRRRWQARETRVRIVLTGLGLAWLREASQVPGGEQGRHGEHPERRAHLSDCAV